MKNATCTSACYDSGAGILYEAGKEYEVDETQEWIQRHFDVPKRYLEKGAEDDTEASPGQEPKPEGKKPEGKKAGGKKAAEPGPGSLE